MQQCAYDAAAKMAKNKSPKNVILRISDPCLCGSGKPMETCHLDVDGRLRKPMPDLRPPLPPTGFAHPSCYLRGTADCSKQLSREHYISKAVLDQLGAVLRISGAHFQKPGESLDTLVGNLTAKILCKRHNEALSPLDTEAASFFSALRDALTDLGRRSLSRKPRFYLIGGEALERWLVKVACGMYYGVGSVGGARVNTNHTIDLGKVERALLDGKWDRLGGLYFRAAPGHVITLAEHVGASPLVDESHKLVGGAMVSLLGFRLEVIFDTTHSGAGAWADLVRRPSELVLRDGPRAHHLVLTWPMGTPLASVNMNQRFRRA